jgi:uncharacterized repeat protein (TIGR01451 family)
MSAALRIAGLSFLPTFGLAVAFLIPSAAQGAAPQAPTSAMSAAVLPSNFQESVVFSGLDHPTDVRFAPDGRVFVAQRDGVIKVFSSLTATTWTKVADLSTLVHNYWDRGLLGLAVDPNFPTNPYIYVLYAFDAPIGGTAPRWGDNCPSPPGATTDGCVISGRLSRLTIDPTSNTMVSNGEQVLINDWCQQYPSHSIGQLMFGSDGKLYVSAGDGASFNWVDYGQGGGSSGSPTPKNPCGDPPVGVGGTQILPTAEGGALRSQSLRRGTGEPVVLNGAILRVDPNTGLASSNNPLISSSDANARRIVGYGLRNPFRFTIRPGTTEIWAGDVGWDTWEEINQVTNPTASPVTNFGWPCYEGDNSTSARLPGYDGANLNLCENLYTTGPVATPYYAYKHGVQVVSGETCSTTNGSAITGLAFYNGGAYPTSYNGALFFADYSRDCIWVMSAGSNGLPDKTQIANFVMPASNPVDLEIGPGGDLFYVDIDGGAIRRIQYAGAGNQPPVAVISANPTSGAAPLTVNFNGSGSSDPDAGDGITAYSWAFGDGTTGSGATVTHTYAAGNYTARLTVTDKHSATGTSSVVISANNTPPTATIDTPAACSSTAPCWAVGDTINFSGHATDQQDTTEPASRLSWKIILKHCPTDLNSCHNHDLQSFSGVSSGSFSAPDHAYPAYLEIQLTATDSGGLQNTASIQLYPRTVNLTFNSSPSSLQLTVNGATSVTPFTRAVIANSISNSISAPSPQNLNGVQYAFQSWSDGGAQTHSVAGTNNATFTANYTPISADVQIVKTGALSADKTRINYTLTVTNKGPATANSVNVTDAIPAKTQFVSASSSQGSCSGTSTVTCSIGSMNKDQIVTITLVVNVTKAAGFISNTATVSTTSPDLNSGNNSSTVQLKAR